MANEPLRITITVEIPPELAIEFYKASIAAQLQGGIAMTQSLQDAWMKIGDQMIGSFASAFGSPLSPHQG